MVFGPESNFRRKIGLESAPRTAFGRERVGDFWSIFELQPLERVRTGGHQQNTPLRSRQEAWGNGIIMIVTVGNGQARHKRRTLQLPVQAKDGCGEFPVAGD